MPHQLSLPTPGERAKLAESVLDNLKEVVFQTDAVGRWTFLNPAWEELTGHKVQDSLGKPFLNFLWPEDRKLNQQRFLPLIKRESEYCRHEIRYLHRDRSFRWVEVFARLTMAPDGSVVGTSGTLSDVTERKRNEEKLRFAASVFLHAGEGIMITAADATIIDVNGAFEKITGYTRAEAVGRNPSMLSSGRQNKEFYDGMWERLLNDNFWQGEVWNRRKSGELYVERLTITGIRNARGKALNYVGIFSDITKQTLQAQHLDRIAHYDPLTGLPNRRLLADRLQHGMAQARRRGSRLVVAYLDLDGFKAINDELGHEYGDQLLVALGSRMTHATRECDTVCRLGGDEFVVVLDDLQNVADFMPMVVRLLEAVAAPVVVERKTLRVTGSIGVAVYPQAVDIDADQLMRQADQAMYRAKTLGKNRYALFGEDLQPSEAQLSGPLAEISLAISRREFVLHYQPIVHLQTGELNSVEALIRWQHPERGLLPPAEFLPLIEGHPMAASLDNWVLDEALRQHQCWLDEGLDVAISVNMSSPKLQEHDFVERLRAKLQANPRVGMGRIKLEVLETSALEDIGHVSRTITECAALGVPFALDDFGTGYSSLLYLKQLPARRIKIDQSFVRDMLVDSDDLAILEGVLGMAAAFKREVIAEGVESIEHARMLVQMGCLMGQGYGIARPMPPQQMIAWATQWRLPEGLAGCRVLDRNSAQLLVASVEHQAWIRSLLDYIRSDAQPMPSFIEEQCRLDMWLEEALHRPQASELVKIAYRLHQGQHELARQILAHMTHGETSALHDAAADLERMGEQLQAALGRLVEGG
ncbi:EAL domain-containing protein [Pseudoduganella sp. OTU4001]|uniref:EAL domain-containing protein n=1 Tax=Pseudoduganella sp. OTU4001 TaxID=3043854 RepID=UPI00313BA028